MNQRKLARTFLLGAAGALLLQPLAALAADTSDITVNGEGGHYAAYRLLGAKSSLSGGCGHTGNSHTEGCYQYTYTVNPKYRNALKNAAADMEADFDADGNGSVTDAEILSGMQAMDAAEVRAYADALWGEVESMEADETTDDRVFEDAPYGHYLIAQTGEPGESGRSLVMLGTAGQPSVAIAAKAGAPVMTRKIVKGSQRVDAISIAKRESVTYETLVRMPSNLGDRGQFAFTVHAKAPGLVRTAGSEKLYVDGQEVEWNEGAGPKNASDGCTEHIEVSQTAKWLCNCGAIVSGTGDDHIMDHIIAGEDDGGRSILASDFHYKGNNQPVTLTANSTITIRYSGTFPEPSTKAAGNVNEAWLTFTNDPYNSASQGETPHDRTTAYSFGVTVENVDGQYAPLPGGDFQLQKQNGSSWADLSYQGSNAGKTMTAFSFTGLSTGTYRLHQTAVPEGHTGVADVVFELRAEYEELSDNPSLRGLSVYKDGQLVSSGSGSAFSVDVPNGTVKTQAVNTSNGIRLPSTGAKGLVAVSLAGALCIVLGFGIRYCPRKKGEGHGAAE